MNENANGELTKLSQKLRREMTKEERHLWYDYLRSLPLTVYRQKVFGRYIADFYIAKAKIVIELDGSQHYTEEGQLYQCLNLLVKQAEHQIILSKEKRI